MKGGELFAFAGLYTPPDPEEGVRATCAKDQRPSRRITEGDTRLVVDASADVLQTVLAADQGFSCDSVPTPGGSASSLLITLLIAAASPPASFPAERIARPRYR